MCSVLQDLGAQVVIVLAGSALAAALKDTKLCVLELHPDEHVCGLFSLSCHSQAQPAELDVEDIRYHERDDKVLLLQTSGTRWEPRRGPTAQWRKLHLRLLIPQEHGCTCAGLCLLL